MLYRNCEEMRAMPNIKKPRKTIRVQQSSGNVFRDLGLSNPNERLAKAQLAYRICEIIDRRKLNQTQAAELMGLDQPKVSALKRGKLVGFSLDRLLRCLNDLGQEVQITVQPARRAQRAETRVVLAEA
jgi:predicted XRE-type DNA-binding protein